MVYYIGILHRRYPARLQNLQKAMRQISSLTQCCRAPPFSSKGTLSVEDAMPDEGKSRSDDPLNLRFIVINDVYELDDLPRYGTALKEAKRQQDSRTVVIGALAGDFLAPSLLSSLDRGRGEKQEPVSVILASPPIQAAI